MDDLEGKTHHYATPWKTNSWKLQIIHLETNMIFQTSMIMFQPFIFRGVPIPPIKGTRFHGPGPRICFSTLDSDVVSGSGPDIFELWTLKCPGKRQTETYVSICFLGDGFKDFYFHLYLGKILILTYIFQLG